MTTTASNIAKYIISEFQEIGDLITNMKVQKLLYYVQGWHLGLYQEPAFDADLEAWVHGPVQPEVYQEYKEYRWHPITCKIEKPNLNQALINHIEQVLQSYGGETAYMLELMSHGELPWMEARGDLPQDAECQNIISPMTMQNYFANLNQNHGK